MKIDQQIKGKNHQIAGRDIVNEGDGFRPDPDNPNLTDCYKCGWPGLSRSADVCPKCGHNYLREWQIERARAIEERKGAFKVLFGLLVLALLAALHLADRTSLSIGQAVGVVAAITICLWFGVSWGLAVLQTWWASRRK